MSYEIHSKEDFDEIMQDISMLKENDDLGKDAYVTLELANALESYRQTDWSTVDTDYHTSIRYRLAECVSVMDACNSPNKFRQLTKTTGLAVGELLHRNTVEIAGKMLDEKSLQSTISDVYDVCYHIAGKTLSEVEWNKFQMKLNQLVYGDTYDVVTEEMNRDRIYMKHNIDPNTPDRELPFYVSQEMENSGVTLKLDDVELS